MLKDLIRSLHVGYLRRLAPRREFSPRGTVLIVAPHPDDEVIGCGGLIARLVAEGRPPFIAILTRGEGSHRGCCSASAEEIAAARHELTLNALDSLGVPRENLRCFAFPDGGIDGNHPEALKLRELIEKIKPDTILVPHWGEGWPDHVKVAQIVQPMLPPGAELWEYCVWMWYYNVWRGLDWRHASGVRLTPAEQALKQRAIELYTAPLAPCGKPWSGVLPKLFRQANSGTTELYFLTQRR